MSWTAVHNAPNLQPKIQITMGINKLKPQGQGHSRYTTKPFKISQSYPNPTIPATGSFTGGRQQAGFRGRGDTGGEDGGQ